MDQLRKPLFLIALVALAIAFCVEIGSNFFRPPRVSREELQRSILSEQRPDEPAPDVDQLLAARQENPPRPGLAIPYMAMLDGLLLFTVALIGASLIIPERVQGRVQGLLTLILTIIIVLMGIVLILAAIALLLLMVGLFLSPPFGTIAYLAIWGFFDRGGASTALGLVFVLKLVFAVCLVLAQQRFLQNKGLVLLVLTSLLGSVIVSFLHGFGPRVITSITDVIAAIVVAVLAVIWAIVFFIGSLVSVVKSIRLAKPAT